MKIILNQCNSTRDIKGNLRILKQGISEAYQNKADVVVFPEMMTTGYMPCDLLCRQEVWDQQEDIADEIHSIVSRSKEQLTVIYGGIKERKFSKVGIIRENVAYIIDKTFHVRIVRKQIVSHDETRYFTPAQGSSFPISILTRSQSGSLGKCNCEVLIGRDIEGYNSTLRTDPVDNLKGDGPLFVISASPYHKDKIPAIRKTIRNISTKLNRPILWCNQVSAHDEIVIGGYSMVVAPDGTVHRAKVFAEDSLTVDLNEIQAHTPIVQFGGKEVGPDDIELWHTYSALKFYIQGYCQRYGFKTVVLGLSGGIDSALVATLAVDALGGENVIGITMPSKFSSGGSVQDSGTLARKLGMPLMHIPIKNLHQSFRDALLDGGKQEFTNSITDENIQPRVRMTILMAISNDYNALLLGTGNKSEIMVAYYTKFGDGSSDLAPISDLWKTEVYSLSRFINKYRGEIIPNTILEKPPSAELKPDHKDIDNLPPYRILDPLLKAILENQPINKLMEISGLSKKKVDKIVKLYTMSEHKRRGIAAGLKLQK